MSKNLRKLSNIKALNFTDINKMTTKELKTVSQTLNDVYNKRMKRIEEAGLTKKSPSYRTAAKANKTRIHTKGKDRNNLLKDIAYVLHKLDDTTSTTTGTKNLQKRMNELIGSLTETELDAFWSNYNKFKEKLKIYNIGSDVLIRQVRNLTDEEVAEKFETRFIHQNLGFYADTETDEVVSREEALERAKLEVIRNKALYGGIDTPEQLAYKASFDEEDFLQ